MDKYIIPLIKKNTNPSGSDNIASGYPLGQHWFNENTGVEYVHTSNGVWNPVGSGSFSPIEHKHYQLHQPNGLNPFVFTDNGGNLHINGNIIQSGSTYETHTEQLYSTKNNIILRDGAVSGLGANEYTGIVAKKYDGVNDGQLVFDKDGWARVGDVGQEQKLATIENISVNGYLMTYHAASNQLRGVIPNTYSLSGHSHTLAGLSEKSYNSLTDRPTSLSQFTNNLGNYGNFLTGINSSQVTAALGYTPSNSNHNHTLSGLTEKSYNSLTDRPTSLSQFTNNLGNYGGFATTADLTGHTHSQYAKQSTKQMYNGVTYVTADVDYADYAGNAYYALGASNADKVKIDNTVVNGASGLQYAQNHGKSGVGITDNPTNDYYHHIIMNHGNSNGYYVQISSCFHNDGVYLRRMENGSLTAQRKFILNDVEPKFNLMADGAGTTSTPKFIEINFNGWAGASSPKARIAATEQSANLHKSDLIFYLNNGSNATNMTERMRIIGNTGTVNINNNLQVGGSGVFNSIETGNIYSNGDCTFDGYLYTAGIAANGNIHCYGDISFDNVLSGNEIICNNLHSYDYISLSGKLRCNTANNTHQLNVGGNGMYVGNAFSYTPSANFVDLSVGSNAGNSRFLFGQSNSFYGGLVWNYNTTGGNATLGMGLNVDGTFKQSLLFKNNGDVDINAKLNVEGVDIGKFNSSGGGWINMPTTGPSGIGHGGAGVNAWIAYSQVNNQWFTGALAGDINYRHTSGALNFGNTSGAMAMQIKNSNVIIGSTVDNGNKLQVTGNITATGEITAYSSSDERLKKNIEPITNGLDIIDKINPVSYNWNDKAIELNPTKSINKSDVGVVAQELEEVLPNLVHSMYDDEYLGVDYIKLIPYLISSVKQLKNEIAELKNEIIELKK